MEAMKQRVALLLLASSILATSLGEQCIPECKGEGNPLYPDPQDCSKYYQCSNGTPYSMSCPEGLHYSPTTEHCEYPEDANCIADPGIECPSDKTTARSETTTVIRPNQTEPTTVTRPNPTEATTVKHPNQTESTTVIRPNPTEPSTTTNQGNPESPTSAQAEDCKPECPWPNAYMPHPQNCTKFYICDANLVAFESSCQPSLFYDMEKLWCDYPDVANCIAGPEHACDELLKP